MAHRNVILDGKRAAGIERIEMKSFANPQFIEALEGRRLMTTSAQLQSIEHADSVVMQYVGFEREDIAVAQRAFAQGTKTVVTSLAPGRDSVTGVLGVHPGPFTLALFRRDEAETLAPLVQADRALVNATVALASKFTSLVVKLAESKPLTAKQRLQIDTLNQQIVADSSNSNSGSNWLLVSEITDSQEGSIAPNTTALQNFYEGSRLQNELTTLETTYPSVGQLQVADSGINSAVQNVQYLAFEIANNLGALSIAARPVVALA